MITPTVTRDEPDASAVLRARLARHGRDLGGRAERLDAQRATVFGTTALRLLKMAMSVSSGVLGRTTGMLASIIDSIVSSGSCTWGRAPPTSWTRSR